MLGIIVLLIATILPSTSFAATSFADLNDYKQAELSELKVYFGVHDKDEGPGWDYFGVLGIRLHILRAALPIEIDTSDKQKIANLLAKNSRFKVGDYGHKFIIEFESNAPWKKDATIVLYVNNILCEDFYREVAKNDEYYMFFLVKGFSTFTMTTEGIVAQFLTVSQMKKLAMIPPY